MPSKLTRRAASVRTKPDGSIRIAVVADTHSRPHPRADEHLRALDPDCILHAGDIGELGVIDFLESIAPTFAIRGNIDVHAPELPDILALEVADKSGPLFTVAIIHIAVYGPKLRADAAAAAKQAGASLVVCGHSHVPFIGRDRGLAIFNPGSIGPRRFQLPIVFGAMELEQGKLRMRHIDCETGLTWSP